MNALAAVALLVFTMLPAQSPSASLNGKWIGTLTRTAPDGRSQAIDWMFNFSQDGKALTGTTGPNADRQWQFDKGTVKGGKVSFKVQQPDGPMRTFTLTLVKDRLQGEMLAELKGQSFTAKVDAERAK